MEEGSEVWAGEDVEGWVGVDRGEEFVFDVDPISFGGEGLEGWSASEEILGKTRRVAG